MALSLARNDAGSNLVGEHEQLALRLFGRLDVYKGNPPERAYYREYLDLAIGTVQTFAIGGHNVKAATLHHVGLALYMAADSTGLIDGTFGTSRSIAAQCRMESATVRRALQILRKLCLFTVRKARGPLGITRWINVGGMTIQAARRRWETQRADANLCPTDTDYQPYLCPTDTTKGYTEGLNQEPPNPPQAGGGADADAPVDQPRHDGGPRRLVGHPPRRRRRQTAAEQNATAQHRGGWNATLCCGHGECLGDCTKCPRCCR